MKRTLILSIKILFSVAVLWFLTHTSKLNFRLLLDLFYSPSLLAPVIALYFLVVIISSWRWHQLNNVQGIKISFLHTIIPTYLGIAFNNLLPGGVGGDFFRCYFLFKKTPNKRSAVMLSILVDRITGLMGVFIAVCIVAAFHMDFFNSHKSTFYFMLFCLSLCIGVIILYFASTLLPKEVGLSDWLSKRFSEKKWLGSILSILTAIRIYRDSKMVIAKCLSASVIIQLFIALTCFLIAKIMHFPEIPFVSYIIAIAVTQIVNLIPITPGGFGIGEAAFAKVLTLLNPGISATYATIFLAYRIIGILAYLPGLAVFIFDHKLLKQNTLHEYPIG